MNATRLISEADIIPNRSSGYELLDDKIQNQAWVSPAFNSTADGALYFNVLDLCKWDQALYGTALLKQSSLDQLWTVFALNDGKPNPDNYGFGWLIDAVNGHKLIAIDDQQPDLARRLASLLDQLVAGTVVKNQLTSELAATLSPEVTTYLMQTLKPVWPSDSRYLVKRTERNGITTSDYRFTKNNETRIVTFALAPDGKVSSIWIEPDPDVR